MLDSLISDSKAAIGTTLKLAGWSAAIAFAALVALVFLSLAAFLSLSDAYGAVTACLSLGGFYAAAALIGAAIFAIMRRRAAQAAENAPAPAFAHWWADPAVIAAGVELVRIVGIRCLVPAVAVGVALMAALQTRPGGSKR